ncbi:hypothetical protein ACFX12_032039 [Malus domestica]
MALSTQRASAFLFSSESAPRWKYDVFLSFRGVDTRKGFVSHLYHELCKCQGIMTFMDDRELAGGTSIPLELPSAIKESHTAIVVLSPNYASSKWCLTELTNIIQCMEAMNSILPVFYGVDPSDVGNQRGRFAEAFAKHEGKLTSTEDKIKVTQWKAALKTVSKISGWDLKNFKCERELIDDIVKCVWRKVQATITSSDSSQKLVGIDSALEQLTMLLALDANDVRFIGITGMGGLGKTTLAKLVFDKIFHHFEVHCFLANVREVCARDRTVVGLQKKLLFPILKKKIEEIWDDECGRMYSMKCLCNKKVLLVLDDVDELNQLEVLAGNQSWFGMGSRIIITTRNEGLLVQHGIATSYKVERLNYGEALELFSLNAFKKDQPEEDFLELSERFLNHAGGLPLVLKVVGSFLYRRGRDAWNSELDNLHKIPNQNIFYSLKVSYDGLRLMEKRIFLDVACFHKGKYTKQVIQVLDNSFGISSCILIDLLIERSLLYNDYGNKIGMHDLIQQMAWTIVRQESEESGLRSRLWLPNDIFHVFMTNTGTRAIEGIVLQLPESKEVRWNLEAFSNMRELSFHLCLLTQLKMRKSKIVRLWKGKLDLPNLKYIDLGFSKKLINTPDFTGVPNLVELALGHCKNLVEIHPSITVLKRLKLLNLNGCDSIKSLPSEVEMDSLESLYLNGCLNVKKIPEFGEQMKNLSKLHLGGTAIEKMPSSIEHLVGLKDLNLFNCKNLLDLPRAICNLKSLRRLCMGQCSKIDKLPGDMDHLETLVLGATLTEPIGGMKNLKHLQLYGSYAKERDGWDILRILGLGKSAPDPPPCRGLMFSSLNRLCTLKTINLKDCKLCDGDIPDDIGCLSFLERLNLGGNNFVSLPESIRCLSKLCYLGLSSCKSLQKLPPLPSNGKLHVDVNDCTSLRSLSDTSKLSSRFINLYDFSFTCRNCIALVQDEGWTNTILSRILKFATQNKDYYRKQPAIFPGSEIPEWFSNQSTGHLVNVELPPPSCTNWLGIAFCVVFQVPKENLANPAAHFYRIDLKIEFLSKPFYSMICGSLVSEHIWVFHLPREICHQEQFLFGTYFSCIGGVNVEADLNKVKKCGARLVYKQDLEELNQTLKIVKRTHEYCDEASPSGPISASFNDTEQIHKKHCY